MDPIFLIGGGALALYLLLRGRGGDEGPVEPPPVKPVDPGTKPVEPINGVYPDAGIDLKKVQEILIQWGYDLGPSGADGKYGPKTQAAIKGFQGKMGEPATGYVDKKTANHLLYTVPPIPSADWFNLAYAKGRDDAMGSYGMRFDMENQCSGMGARKGGTCDPQFVKGYQAGHAKGARDAGYPIGYDMGKSGQVFTEDSPMPVSSTNANFRAGFWAGYEKGRAEIGGGSTAGVRGDVLAERRFRRG